jgi:hypothetical protein
MQHHSLNVEQVLFREINAEANNQQLKKYAADELNDLLVSKFP